MPYQKTKEGRLVNEVTLGDGYPLSNDLQPLKIGGEASVIEISHPLPDGSDNGLFKVNGDLDITGTLKTKLSHDLIYDFDDEVNTLAQAKIDALIDSAPAALDTLNELAAALNDDASFSTTVTNSLATKLNLSGGTMTGDLIIAADNKIKSDTTGTHNFIEFDDDSGSPANQTLISSVTNVVALCDGNNNGTGHFEVLKGGTDSTATELFRIENSGDAVLDGDFKVLSGHVYKISSNDVLSQTTLGSTVVNSSLTNVGTLGSLTVSGDATFDTNTLHVDATNNRVGIGTTSPSTELQVDGTGTFKNVDIFDVTEGNNPRLRVGRENAQHIEINVVDLDNTIKAEQDTDGNGDHNFILDREFAGTGANNFKIQKGGSDQLVIDTNGNVGIGTTSPDATLEVNGAVHIEGGTYVNTSETKDDAALVLEENFNIYVAESGYLRNLISKENDVITLGQAPTNFIDEIRLIPGTNGFVSVYDDDGTTETIRLQGDGKVGIGTTSPNHLLHVGDDATAAFVTNPDKAIQLSSTTNDEEIAYILYSAEGTNNIRSKYFIDDDIQWVGWDSTFSTGLFGYKWQIAGNDKMALTTSGNLGIGTTSPSVELEVNGDIKANELTLDGTDAGITITNTGAIEMHFDAGTGHAANITSNNAIYMLAGSSQKLHFGANNTNSQMALDDGKLGIGTTSPTTTLDVEGTVSYKHISLTDSSDDLDVSGCTVVECTPSGTDTLGGLTGGVQGQILHILKVDSGLGRIIIEHNEGTGNQDIFLSGGSDVMLSSRGGITLYCNGTSWFALDK